MTSRLTGERIAEIEARLTNTNPGQRSVHKRKDGSLCVSLGNPERGAHQQADFYFSEGEVDFFTQGKFDAEELLAEVKTLKAEKAQAEAERDALIDILPSKAGCPHYAVLNWRNDMDKNCGTVIYCTTKPRQCWLKYAQQQAEKKLQENPHG